MRTHMDRKTMMFFRGATAQLLIKLTREEDIKGLMRVRAISPIE